jgi:hypothetical protein
VTKEVNEPDVKHNPACESISTGMKSPDKGRRQFIKKAIVTAPVILTVTSRPVWATNCTWSGQLSGNLSDAGPPCGGEGCSAEYWAANTEKWHYEFCVTKLFNDVFEVNAFKDTPTPATLGQVITGNANPEQPPNCNKKDLAAELARQAVAALENSATAVSFELPVCQVKYWFEFYYYGPCEGVNSLQEGINFFQSLNEANELGCPL